MPIGYVVVGPGYIPGTTNPWSGYGERNGKLRTPTLTPTRESVSQNASVGRNVWMSFERPGPPSGSVNPKMPSSPGSLPVANEYQAGIVFAG